ncbi:MAG: glycosyltransferase family 1 protein, partial [Pontixanthobacter sp.]
MTKPDGVFIDVTRLVARRWSGRQATGIDRVCEAYLDHFAHDARAVIQHRGVFRIFGEADSRRLFALLRDAHRPFRTAFSAFAIHAFARARSQVDAMGACYINVGHTDFDLPRHARWIARCDMRAVYMVHDLIPLTHGDLCSEHAIARHRGRVLQALDKAAGIVVNSHATETELRAFAAREGRTVPPVLCAHLAGGVFAPANRVSVSTRPYFLTVGTIERRKNHMTLFRAWRDLIAQLGPDCPRLVVAGQVGPQTSAIRAFLARHPQLDDHITILASCSDPQLGSLIDGAVAMLLPSLSEGFGIPLIEALERKTPVIASDLPSLREIGQGIPVFPDPLAVEDWVAMIAAYCGNGPERSRQMERMRAYRP